MWIGSLGLEMGWKNAVIADDGSIDQQGFTYFFKVLIMEGLIFLFITIYSWTIYKHVHAMVHTFRSKPIDIK